MAKGRDWVQAHPSVLHSHVHPLRSVTQNPRSAPPTALQPQGLDAPGLCRICEPLTLNSTQSLLLRIQTSRQLMRIDSWHASSIPG